MQKFATIFIMRERERETICMAIFVTKIKWFVRPLYQSLIYNVIWCPYITVDGNF